MNKQVIHNWQEILFNISIYTTYILIVLSSFGLSQSAPTYLATLDYYIRIYICLFLLWRFNPLRTQFEFTKLDAKIAFSAGLFMLTTTALNKYLNDVKDKVKTIIDNNDTQM